MGIKVFSCFFLRNGLLLKYKNKLSFILQNLNYFLNNKKTFISENYTSIGWVLDDVFEKNLNFVKIFNMTTNLIKPPFVVKSLLVPKKIKKKMKQKYLVKIVYTNETKRINNSYKQIKYYSNKFANNRFNVRLYKAILMTFLE